MGGRMTSVLVCDWCGEDERVFGRAFSVPADRIGEQEYPPVICYQCAKQVVDSLATLPAPNGDAPVVPSGWTYSRTEPTLSYPHIDPTRDASPLKPGMGAAAVKAAGDHYRKNNPLDVGKGSYYNPERRD